MSPTEWRQLEATLDGLTAEQKRRLVARLSRSLHVEDDETLADRQRAAMRRLREGLEALPVHNPDDGWSNRDHDRFIYGDAS